MAYNYKLTLAYDGTNYCGWQIQPNGVSIQEILQKNIAILTKQTIHVIGSGRTDAGVHARGQVCNFHTNSPIEQKRFHYSLNSLLPSDIRVIDITEVPLDFHARYSAKAKIYHYHLRFGNIQDPFQRLYCTLNPTPINISVLKSAATLFIGTHDFTSLANEAHRGSAAHSPIKTIYRLDVIEDGKDIRLEFEGDGFLYKMVRNIVGLLIEVASGKRPIEDISLVLAAKDRRKAGQAAPAHGLFLMQVYY